MHARKLMLTVLGGGPLLGLLAGLSVDTSMQPAPEPSWRKLKPDVIFTSAPQPFAEAGPEDLSPYRGMRLAMLARRFSADADRQPVFAEEPPAVEPVALPIPATDPDASLAAAPSNSARLAATGAIIVPDAAAASEPTLVPVDLPSASAIGL